MRHLAGLLLAATALAAAGCANPFAANYVCLAVARHVDPAPPEGEPKLLRGETDDALRARLLEDNYVQIGAASFYDTARDDAAALAQAKDVGASLVVVSKKFRETLKGSVPLLTSAPQTLSPGGGFSSTSFEPPGARASAGTSQIPFTVEQYDYTATFWARDRSRPILGAYGRRLGPAESGCAGAEGAVLVVAVRKGSPAEKAGMLRGDVLLQVGGDGVVDPESLDRALRAHAGRTVPLRVLRQGKAVELQAALNQG